MTFESSYENYIINNYTMIDWTPTDDRKIWHIIYRVPEDKAGEIANLAAKNHAGLIHITPADMPNPYNTLPSVSYMEKVMNAVPGGSPLVGNLPPFPKDGSPAATPNLVITGADYTSLSVEWSYPNADPYGFAIYSSEEELVRIPGYLRRATMGNIQEGTSMSMTIRAVGADGKEGSPSPSSAGGTSSLTENPVRNVRISPGNGETIVEAEVVLPYGFIRLYFTDSDRFHNFPAWPISYGGGFVTTHYMVEGRTLFKYTGSNETDAHNNREWKWTEVGKRDNCKVIRDKTSYKWIIPLGTSNEDVDPGYVIVQTEGYNPSTNVFLPCPSNMSEKKGTKSLYCIGQPPYDCQGAPLCGHTIDMIKHCDLAANKLVHGTDEIKMYTANKPLGENGMCSVNPVTGQGCKVYIQGKDENGVDCTFSGDDMWKAYQDIKDLSGCKKCGTKHLPNRCMISRDYHFDAFGGGCGSSAATISRVLGAQMNNTAQVNETSSVMVF
jgi:hypothetical protein